MTIIFALFLTAAALAMLTLAIFFVVLILKELRS
jgi:hypothetical protein